MAIDRTLCIVKPDAVAAGNTGNILAFLEGKGARFRAMKLVQLNRAQAEGFYAEHKGRGFFGELIEFMTSGPCLLVMLEGDNVQHDYRNVWMGQTDPAQAAEGTLRKRFAESKGKNAVHGSDSPEAAARELAYFFSGCFDVV
ncbi:MAG: nucleoside-diphosphate kinase [Myxococcales bacterium]|nr:nucleoside-diphosphate kinase [Myxococcales bacterium]